MPGPTVDRDLARQTVARLRGLKDAGAVSLGDVARQCGWDHRRLGRYMSGGTVPTPASCAAINSALDRLREQAQRKWEE